MIHACRNAVQMSTLIARLRVVPMQPETTKRKRKENNERSDSIHNTNPATPHRTSADRARPGGTHIGACNVGMRGSQRKCFSPGTRGHLPIGLPQPDV
jgi:hypothetical protein